MNLARNFLLMIICIGAAAACKKDSAENNQLRGRWELSESFTSDGGPGSWKPSTKKLQVIFGNDGRLSGDAYAVYKKYKVKDSVTLSFYDSNNSIQKFRYSIQGNSLYLSPDGPIQCIEGCSSRYVKLGE